MALKRTRCMFFGKGESRATRAAAAAFARGDMDGANRIHAAVSRSRAYRKAAHAKRGFRKLHAARGR